jgi:Tfp pilus assembly protein PilF
MAAKRKPAGYFPCAPLVSLLFLCAVTAVFPDIVHLKSGGKFEGKVTERKDDILLITKTGSAITILKSDIERIERKDLPADWGTAKPKPTIRPETPEPKQPSESGTASTPALGEPVLDPFLGFKLRFPFGWRRRAEPSRRAILTFIGLRELGYPPKIDLLVVESSSELENFATEIEESYASVTTGYKSAGRTRISGNGIRVSGTFGLNDTTVFHSDAIFKREGVYFILALKCNEGSKDQHLKGFDAVIGSFESTSPASLSREDRARFKEHFNGGVEAANAGGKDEEAVASLRTAAEILPGHPDVHRALANLYVRQNRFDLATKELRALVELFPDSAECHYNLGTHLHKMNRYEDAAASLQKSVELNPNLIEAYVNLGVIYKLNGQVQEAIRSLTRAIEIEPSSVTAHFNLGQVYLQKKALREARKEFEKVIEIDPQHKGAQSAIEELNKAQPPK